MSDAPSPPPPGSTIGSPSGRGHDARRALAAAGEQMAADHLERLGYRLLARNHRTRQGELDIVATDGRAVVFVEVKTQRAGRGDSEPWRNLGGRKRLRVRAMATAYLHSDAPRPRGLAVRFDAISVIVDARGRLVSLDHREAAF